MSMLGFMTESEPHARAAAVLYAMYKSREPSSPMMGADTWKRFHAYAHGSAVKSTTMGEFVENFCHSGKVLAIVPKFLRPPLASDAPAAGDMENVFEDDELLPLIENETQYLTLLVRRRIQDEKLTVEREKAGGAAGGRLVLGALDDEDDDEDWDLEEEEAE